MKRFLRTIEDYEFSIILIFGILCLMIGIIITVSENVNSEEVITTPKEEIQIISNVPVETYHIEADEDVDYIVPALPCEKSETTHLYLDIPLDQDLQDYVWMIAGEYALDPYLIFAVMYVESKFDPNVISTTDDYGLMQINICNHAWLSAKYGITNFLDPYQNILAGADILSEKIHKTNDFRTGLMSYNLGEGTASYLWSIGQYTSDYAEKVMGMYEYYKQNSWQ